MDTNLDLDAIRNLVASTAMLVNTDTRTLENDNKIGSYIFSAQVKLVEAASLLSEAYMLEQDEYESRPRREDIEVEGAPF
jgi:hypothetical protein